MSDPLLRRPADDPDAFKAAFGRFATGVAVASCAPDGDGPTGVTINALASVSLDPPLALFCLEERSVTLPGFLTSGHFALNFLAEDQTALSDRFAVEHSFRDEDGREVWQSGAPILSRALSVADCALLDTHGGGDHVVLMGRVLSVGWREDARPLLYYRGGYGRFAP